MQTQSEVSAQDGYEAARDRLMRTIDALVLAEARINVVIRERDAAYSRIEILEREVEELTAPDEEVEGTGAAVPEPCPLEKCNCHLRVDKDEDEVAGDATD